MISPWTRSNVANLLAKIEKDNATLQLYYRILRHLSMFAWWPALTHVLFVNCHGRGN
jgi:hypothetical protein